MFADDHATSTPTQAPLYSRAGGDIANTPRYTGDNKNSLSPFSAFVAAGLPASIESVDDTNVVAPTTQGVRVTRTFLDAAFV